MLNINYWAILACGVASMVIGSIWYGPLFGKIWIQLMGFTKEQMESAKKSGMAMQYAMAFASSIVMAYVLDLAMNFLRYFAAAGIQGALLAAFWAWIGFVVPV